jgi:hypothetical protein
MVDREEYVEFDSKYDGSRQDVTCIKLNTLATDKEGHDDNCRATQHEINDGSSNINIAANEKSSSSTSTRSETNARDTRQVENRRQEITSDQLSGKVEENNLSH